MKRKITLILIGFLVGGVLFGSIGVVFGITYNASNITYSPTDNTWNVSTVGEAINDLALSKTSDNYSTEEQVVGTWVDGKPIYQKVISGLNLAMRWVNQFDTTCTVSPLVNNAEQIILATGIDSTTKHSNVPLQIRVSANSDWTLIGFDDNTINSIIIQYTKTENQSN